MVAMGRKDPVRFGLVVSRSERWNGEATTLSVLGLLFDFGCSTPARLFELSTSLYFAVRLNLIGQDIEQGLLPARWSLLGAIVEAVCC